MIYDVYAEDTIEAAQGKTVRRFLGKCEGSNTGSGIFDLYADECGDQEEIVIVQAEESKAAALLGRKGRAVNSLAQQAASRENGTKGGAPKKLPRPEEEEPEDD